MKFKKSLLTSLLISSLYVSSASASLRCESFPYGSFCENTAPFSISNSYGWNVTGVLYFMSGGSTSFMAELGCLTQGVGTVTSTVTLSNGITQTYTKNLICSTGGGTVGSASGGTSCFGSFSCT